MNVINCFEILCVHCFSGLLHKITMTRENLCHQRNLWQNAYGGDAQSPQKNRS